MGDIDPPPNMEEGREGRSQCLIRPLQTTPLPMGNGQRHWSVMVTDYCRDGHSTPSLRRFKMTGVHKHTVDGWGRRVRGIQLVGRALGGSVYWVCFSNLVDWGWVRGPGTVENTLGKLDAWLTNTTSVLLLRYWKGVGRGGGR